MNKYNRGVLRRYVSQNYCGNCSNKTVKSIHFASTHVQYTQMDTIRQTDGPLVPMVRLVPIENGVIPMVLLVNVHLIKGT